MHDLVRDLRLAVRMLARKPGLSALAVVSLALGIGVNSSIFTLVNAVLLRELPIDEPERVVEVYTSDSGGFRWATTSYPDYLDLRRESSVFSELAAVAATFVTHDDGERTEVLFGEEVSGNFFDLLGLPLALGRGFEPLEETPGAHPVVVLGNGFWRQRFGADRDVLGQTLALNGIDFRVIGVAPAEYRASLSGLTADFWIPVAMHDAMSEDASLDRRGSRSLFLKGRLAPGVALETAQAELDLLAARLAEAYPETNEGRELTAVPSTEVAINPGVDGPLFGVAGLLLVVVALVLLIACSNIANLLLARAADRRREIAVRLALGSSRGRLIRQLLVEGLVLAAAGAALGLLFALWTSRLIVGFQPPLPIAIALDLGLDLRVFGFTLVLGLLAGLLCGLAPALQASRADLVAAIKNESASLRRGTRRFGLQGALVVAQVALTTVLLVGAGLFVRSLASAQATDTGFSLERGAAVAIGLGFGGRYSEEEGRIFQRQLREVVAATPGIKSASWAGYLPLSFVVNSRDVQLEGQEEVPEDEWPEVDTVRAGPGYFETLGIPLTRGRGFDDRDGAQAPPVVVVNEALAEKHWPGEEPLGKRLRFADDAPWAEVVGVARTGKYRTLGEDARPFVYRCHLQDYSSLMTLVVASDDEEAALTALRRELEALDPRVPIFDQRLISEHLDVALFPARMGAALLAAFGVLGLVLASVGLYGVVAYSVSRRTREVGIRMAIGARRADVLSLVTREGMVLVAVGLALGIGAALFAARALGSLLYGITPHDPLTFATVATILATVALAANLLPARRATQVDPMEALRYE
ncbi:MAG: ABC transporter permease [bacterium]|nr:ABC transporter permease [bacterium]